MKNDIKKINKLKKEAKKYYLEYCELDDKYDCGLKLSQYLLPDMMYCKVKFNQIMDELAKLDPDTPKARL